MIFRWKYVKNFRLLLSQKNHGLEDDASFPFGSHLRPIKNPGGSTCCEFVSGGRSCPVFSLRAPRPPFCGSSQHPGGDHGPKGVEGINRWSQHTTWWNLYVNVSIFFYMCILRLNDIMICIHMYMHIFNDMYIKNDIDNMNNQIWLNVSIIYLTFWPCARPQEGKARDGKARFCQDPWRPCWSKRVDTVVLMYQAPCPPASYGWWFRNPANQLIW